MTPPSPSTSPSPVTATHFRSRVVPAFLVGFIAVFFLSLGGLPWMMLAYVSFILMAKELFQLLEAKGIYPSKITVMLFGSAFYVGAYWNIHSLNHVLVTLGVIVSFITLLFRPRGATISDIGATILSFFYLGFLPAHYVMLRQLGETGAWRPFYLDPGFQFAIWVALTIVVTDVVAYYSGKRLGKKLLYPQISPAKTLEGAIYGTLGGVAVSSLVAWVCGFAWIHGVLFGIIVSLVAQLGDLSESLLKRDAGVKHSGELLLGHGGLLDRLDGFLFSGAVAYYYIVWFMLHQGLAKEILEYFYG